MSQFMAITDQSADVARGCLEMTEGDVMAAVNMFFENPEIANSFNNPAPAAAATSSTAAAAAAPSRPQASTRSRPIGREDDAGVIHIDDDDDDVELDDALDDFDEDEEDRNSNPANLQRIAQESDDAAMARRLQEEMYGGGGGAAAGGGLVDPDGVRAPIARTTETLVAPSGYGGYGIGDDSDDVETAMREMARRRARPASMSRPLLFTAHNWNQANVCQHSER